MDKVLEQPGILARPRSLSAQDPSHPKIKQKIELKFVLFSIGQTLVCERPLSFVGNLFFTLFNYTLHPGMPKVWLK